MAAAAAADTMTLIVMANPDHLEEKMAQDLESTVQAVEAHQGDIVRYIPSLSSTVASKLPNPT